MIRATHLKYRLTHVCHQFICFTPLCVLLKHFLYVIAGGSGFSVIIVVRVYNIWIVENIKIFRISLNTKRLIITYSG